MKARREPTMILDEVEERAFEELLDAEVGRLHLLADHLEMRGDDAADHRLEQLDLGLEIEIGQPLAHLGARGDVFEPRAGEALLGEFLEGRGDDLLRADFLVAAALSCLSGLLRRRFCLCHFLDPCRSPGQRPGGVSSQYND